MTVPITGLEPRHRHPRAARLRAAPGRNPRPRRRTPPARARSARRQLVGDRLQRARLQVAVLARPLEIVEHAQQLADDGGLGPIRRGLLVAQRALAVVGEVGLDPLQVGDQLGDLVGVGRTRRRRPGLPPLRGPAPGGTCRTSPVSGSIRRLSVTVTGSCGLPGRSLGLPVILDDLRVHDVVSRAGRHRARPSPACAAPRPGWPRRSPGPAPGTPGRASPSPT